MNPDTLSPIDRILWRHGHFVADQERHRQRGTLRFCRFCRTEHTWSSIEKRRGGCRTAMAWYAWIIDDEVEEAKGRDWILWFMDQTPPAEYHLVCGCGHVEIHGDTRPRRECRVCSEIREDK